MAITQNTFTGNGSNLGPFSFTFKWLEPTDIKVSVGGVLKTAGTHYNLQNLNYTTKTGGEVLFTGGNTPASGAAIRVFRDTDDSALSSTFNSGSAIRAQDLNDNFTQNLYVTQEINNNAVQIDGSQTMVGDLDMGGYQINNLAEPTVDDDAATKYYIDQRFGVTNIPAHTRWRKTATAGQTTFSGTGDYGGSLTYSALREQVYLNGALQQRSADYTADNGTSIVFSVPLTVGDVVDVVCVNNTNTSGISNAANLSYSGQFSGQTVRTVAAKLADVVSVKDFGAVGDGVANDTAAIQAAIDQMTAGKCLHFPAGTYMVTGLYFSGTSQNKTNLSFIGDGAVLKLFPNTAGKNVAEIVSGSDYYISGLTFWGAKDTVTYANPVDAMYRWDNGLYIGSEPGTNKTVNKVTVESCKAYKNRFSGFMIGSGPIGDFTKPSNDPTSGHGEAHNITISGCVFEDNEAGFSGGYQFNVTYTGNLVYNNAHVGAFVDIGSKVVSFVGNTIDHPDITWPSSAAINVYDADHVSITGNSITASKTGVFIQTGAQFNTISNNTIYDCGEAGIKLDNSTNTVVEGNTIYSPGLYGIWLTTNNNFTTIANNVINGAGWDGIRLDNMSSITFSGNIVIGSGGSGFYVTSCSWLRFIGNQCLNNNTGNDANSSGFRISNSSGCQFIGNSAFDTQVTKTQNYGIKEEGTSAANFYIGNYLSANKLGESIFVGTSNSYIGAPGSTPKITLPSGSAASPALGFTAKDTSGLYLSGTEDVGVAVNGLPSTVFMANSGATNYPVLRSNSTGAVDVFAAGGSADINVAITPKGAGACVLYGSNAQAKVIANSTGVGFQGTTGIAKPTVTGSKGANAALTSLLTALANYGLITDSTT